MQQPGTPASLTHSPSAPAHPRSMQAQGANPQAVGQQGGGGVLDQLPDELVLVVLRYVLAAARSAEGGEPHDCRLRNGRTGLAAEAKAARCLAAVCRRFRRLLEKAHLLAPQSSCAKLVVGFERSGELSSPDLLLATMRLYGMQSRTPNHVQSLVVEGEDVDCECGHCPEEPAPRACAPSYILPLCASPALPPGAFAALTSLAVSFVWPASPKGMRLALPNLRTLRIVEVDRFYVGSDLGALEIESPVSDLDLSFTEFSDVVVAWPQLLVHCKMNVTQISRRSLHQILQQGSSLVTFMYNPLASQLDLPDPLPPPVQVPDLQHVDARLLWLPRWRAPLASPPPSGAPSRAKHGAWGGVVCFTPDTLRYPGQTYCACHADPHPPGRSGACDRKGLQQALGGARGLWLLENGDLPYRGIDGPLATMLAICLANLRTLTLGPIQNFGAVFPIVVDHLTKLESLTLKADTRALANTRKVATERGWAPRPGRITELNLLDLGGCYLLVEHYVRTACPRLRHFYCGFALPQVVDTPADLPVSDEIFGLGTALPDMRHFYRTVSGLVVRAEPLQPGPMLDDLRAQAYNEHLRNNLGQGGDCEVGVLAYTYGPDRHQIAIDIGPLTP